MVYDHYDNAIETLKDRCDKLEREVVIIKDTLISLQKDKPSNSESSAKDSITYADWDFSPKGSYKSESFLYDIRRKKDKK